VRRVHLRLADVAQLGERSDLDLPRLELGVQGVLVVAQLLLERHTVRVELPIRVVRHLLQAHRPRGRGVDVGEDLSLERVLHV